MKINTKLIRLGLCVLGNLGVPLVSLNDFYRYLGIAQDKFGEDHVWIPRDEVYPKWYEDNPIGFDNRIIEGDDGEMSLIIDICNYPTNVRKAV